MKIENVLDELNIEYYISGDEAVAKCPSHDDKHPSWSVNIKTGVHNCFACGFSGNLAFLVHHVLELSYPEAVLWVNERIGWARAHQWRENYRNNYYSPPVSKISEADMALFVDPPENVLTEKNITSFSASFFGIKWNQGEEEWITPVRDPFSFELWGYQAKNARNFRNHPKGMPKSKTLFGLESFQHGSTAILVESPIDCARLLSAGQGGGLSSFGVSVSDRQLSLIQRVTESAIFAFDRDMPGMAQTIRICEEFDGIKNIRIYNYGNSEAKDPGEQTNEEIKFGVENAIPILRWNRVYRAARRVSETSRGKVLVTWELINSIYNGTG